MPSLTVSHFCLFHLIRVTTYHRTPLLCWLKERSTHQHWGNSTEHFTMLVSLIELFPYFMTDMFQVSNPYPYSSVGKSTGEKDQRFVVSSPAEVMFIDIKYLNLF